MKIFILFVIIITILVILYFLLKKKKNSTEESTTTTTYGPTTTTTTPPIDPGIYVQMPDSSGALINVEYMGTIDGYPNPSSGGDNDIYIYAINTPVTIGSISVDDPVNFNINIFPDSLVQPYVISNELPGYVNWKIGFSPSGSGVYNTQITIGHDALNVPTPFVIYFRCNTP